MSARFPTVCLATVVRGSTLKGVTAKLDSPNTSMDLL